MLAFREEQDRQNPAEAVGTRKQKRPQGQDKVDTPSGSQREI